MAVTLATLLTNGFVGDGRLGAANETSGDMEGAGISSAATSIATESVLLSVGEVVASVGPRLVGDIAVGGAAGSDADGARSAP